MKTKSRIENDSEILAFIGAELEGDCFYEFVQTIQELLPGKIVSEDILESSCRHLLGQPLSFDELATLAWRLAANLPRLRSGYPVFPWDGQVLPEWVIAQIIDWKLEKNRKRKLGARFFFKVLTGQAATEVIEEFWSRNYCHFLATRLGFTRRSGVHPFIDVRELSGLRVLMQIEAENPKLSYAKLAFPSSCVSWNKKQIKRRARIGFNCPKGYPRRHTCYQCHVGRDCCPAAVHARSYTRHFCEQCRRESWFDFGDVCVDCHARNIFAGREEPV